MSRQLKIGTVQMDAAPAPTPDRLERAAKLIAGAADQGAQLIVLPELFNAGYEYHDRNYKLAEPITGTTMTWMKAQAAQHNVHLAGSFLLLDGAEVYNSAFIVAPDGRTWRYDKIYPYGWERAYFREGRDTTIADTDLGKFGLLICWDTAHLDLWQRYAGQIDALVITSCPPLMHRADLVFPDGKRLPSTVLGQSIPQDAHFQDQDVEDQAGWLRVPVVTSNGAGKFSSHLPVPQVSVAGMLAPGEDWQRYLPVAADALLEAGYGRFAKIIDAGGKVIACVDSDGDGSSVAAVEFADTPTAPTARQPRMRLPAAGRLAVDGIIVHAMIPRYRAGVRRQWGRQMAPVDPRTRLWAVVTAGAALIGLLAGLILGQRR